jgi:hypothetical protein
MAKKREPLVVEVKATEIPKAVQMVKDAHRQGWEQGYGQGRDDEAAGDPLRTYEERDRD